MDYTTLMPQNYCTNFHRLRHQLLIAFAPVASLYHNEARYNGMLSSCRQQRDAFDVVQHTTTMTADGIQSVRIASLSIINFGTHGRWVGTFIGDIRHSVSGCCSSGTTLPVLPAARQNKRSFFTRDASCIINRFHLYILHHAMPINKSLFDVWDPRCL